MELNDFLNKIVSEHKAYYIVGPNTSGKSYTLKRLYDELGNDTLYIDELGFAGFKKRYSAVVIHEGTYIYERSDAYNRDGIENYPISDESMRIINYVNKYIDDFRTSEPSLGSDKILGILEPLVSYNLNNINYILLDEPEIGLDDNKLKILSGLIDVLANNGKSIVIVTHSPRLLELNKADIKSIYSKPFKYSELLNIAYDEILCFYNESRNTIKKIEKETSHNVDKVSRLKFDSNETFTRLYLNMLLTSFEFYRSLFYDEIIILEGLTERLIVKELGGMLDNNDNFFYADGKYRVFFLIKLFRALGLKVMCILDSDVELNVKTDKEKSKRDFSISFNKRLNELAKEDSLIKIKFFNYDLESEIGVDLNGDYAKKVYKELFNEENPKSFEKFSNQYKAYIPYYAMINNDEIKSKLEKKLSDDSSLRKIKFNND